MEKMKTRGRGKVGEFVRAIKSVILENEHSCEQEVLYRQKLITSISKIEEVVVDPKFIRSSEGSFFTPGIIFRDAKEKRKDGNIFPVGTTTTPLQAVKCLRSELIKNGNKNL